MPDDVLPAGPIFGPDFVTISLADGRGTSFEVPIYPDANNAELKAGGLAVMFYFQPARVFLANRRNSDDLDFSMRPWSSAAAVPALPTSNSLADHALSPPRLRSPTR